MAHDGYPLLGLTRAGDRAQDVADRETGNPVSISPDGTDGGGEVVAAWMLVALQNATTLHCSPGRADFAALNRMFAPGLTPAGERLSGRRWLPGSWIASRQVAQAPSPICCARCGMRGSCDAGPPTTMECDLGPGGATYTILTGAVRPKSLRRAMRPPAGIQGWRGATRP
jgi:hypothetical protein